MAGFGVRKDQRLKELIPVRYLHGGLVGEGLIKDLSLNGSYITGNALVSFIGEILSLQLFVPGEPEPLTIDRATVKWMEGSNFGVDFALNPQLAESMTAVISRLVTAHHGAFRKGPDKRSHREKASA